MYINMLIDIHKLYCFVKGRPYSGDPIMIGAQLYRDSTTLKLVLVDKGYKYWMGTSHTNDNSFGGSRLSCVQSVQW